MKIKLKNSLFFKYLIPYTAILIIPTIIFTLFINNILLKTLRKQYSENSIQSLNQLVYITDNNMVQLQSIQQHIILNRDLNATFNISDVTVAQNIIKELAKYKVSNNFIDDIVIYFHGDNYFYTANSTYSIDAFLDKLSVYPQWDSNKIMNDITKADKQTIISLYNKDSTKNLLAVLSPIKLVNNNATLIFFMDATKSYKLDESSILMLLDKNKQIISALNVPEQLGNAQLEQLNKLAEDGGSNYNEISIPKVNGKYLATALVSQNTGWKYISMTPVNKVYKEVTRIQIYFVIILLIVVIISSVIIQISMLANYRPVSKLETIATNINKNAAVRKGGIETIQNTLTYLATENTTLKSTVTSAAKMQFLQSLLKGKVKDVDEFNEKLAKYGLDLLKQQFYCVLIIVFNGKPDNSEEISEANELETYLNRFIYGYIHAHSERNIFYFIGSMDDEKKVMFKHNLQKIHEDLQKIYKCNIVVASSTLCDSYEKIPQCYLEASLANDYRFIKGNNRVIESSELVLKDNITMAYPHKLFDKLSYQIKQGDADEVERALTDIIVYIKESDISLYYAKGLCYQLINNISSVISDLNNDLLVRSNDISYATVLADFNTVDDLINAVKNICLNICSFVISNKEEKDEEIISLMKAYINDNYCSKSFSVQSMADHFGMTLPAISLFFKNHCNTTIINYLTNTRMNRAKQLLVETDYPLNDITDAIGYVNTSSFIRKFKALNGITPGQFVKAHKNSDNEK